MPDLPEDHRTPTNAAKHQKAYNRQSKRKYHTGSKAWGVIRRQTLFRDSYRCQAKEHAYGCNGIATEVDHIDGDDSNNAPENRQSLSKQCHARKTAREQGGFGNAR